MVKLGSKDRVTFKDNILVLLTLQHCCLWLAHCSAGDKSRSTPPAVKVACTPYFGFKYNLQIGWKWVWSLDLQNLHRIPTVIFQYKIMDCFHKDWPRWWWLFITSHLIMQSNFSCLWVELGWVAETTNTLFGCHKHYFLCLWVMEWKGLRLCFGCDKHY